MQFDMEDGDTIEVCLPALVASCMLPDISITCKQITRNRSPVCCLSRFDSKDKAVTQGAPCIPAHRYSTLMNCSEPCVRLWHVSFQCHGFI